MASRLIHSLCTITPLLGGTGVATAQGYDPVVGQAHADFTLPRIDTREPVALSQFRGKKVLLIQFASW
jgi:hypothetical protein